MKYNPQIHHRRSIRLRGYDYSKAGLYFITICCANNEHHFGKIENDEMILNDAGQIADQCWLEIPKHFPNAVLHEHVVMPNHIHGIIELTDVTNVGVENFQPLPDNTERTVGAENFLPPQHQHNEFQKMIPRSISSIVKGFKIGVTKWFRNNANATMKTYRGTEIKLAEAISNAEYLLFQYKEKIFLSLLMVKQRRIICSGKKCNLKNDWKEI